MTDERLAWSRRARDRAGAVLKPGDKLTARRCPGRLVTVRFMGWDGHWACSPTLMDISPVNIEKVNGQAVDFTNGEPRPPA